MNYSPNPQGEDRRRGSNQTPQSVRRESNPANRLGARRESNPSASQGVKKELAVYANGARRESTVYPNGVRKDNIIYPNGEKTETIVYANGSHFDNGAPPEYAAANRRMSAPIAGQQSMASMAARKKSSSAAQRRKSVVNFVAPPIKNLDAATPKCCCCLNVRIGSVIIGFVELIGLGFALYQTVHWFMETASAPESSNRNQQGGRMRYAPFISRNGILAGCVIAIILFFFAILSMFYGLWKKKTSFILPHLVIQAFAVLGALVGIVIVSIAVAVLRQKSNSKSADDNDDSDGDLNDVTSNDTYNFCVAILVFCILTFVLEIYFFCVVRSSARFYNVDDQEEETADTEMPSWANYVDPMAPPVPWYTPNQASVPPPRYA